MSKNGNELSIRREFACGEVGKLHVPVGLLCQIMINFYYVKYLMQFD